ncbi:MAG: phosphatase PAP2 family protein [Actinobacteria bacterium]|jgi:undecaprenyl-diphosphatase|nr:phosphatase PAP2 family protein [Actinomycetota bacterium]
MSRWPATLRRDRAEASAPPSSPLHADVQVAQKVRHRSSRAAWILGGALVAGWAALTAWVRATAPDVPAVDQQLHDAALGLRTPTTIDLANAVSVLGEVRVALPLAVLGAVLVEASTRRYARLRAGVIMAVVGGAGVLVGLGLNRLVGRERPVPDQWAGAAGGPSFPSGHTTAAVVGAVLLAWALSRRTERRSGQVLIWALAAVWAVGVGWSRVWLGVHWPTDVLCAWLFVPSLLVLARAAQLTWWPSDAPPEPVLPAPDAVGATGVRVDRDVDGAPALVRTLEEKR